MAFFRTPDLYMSERDESLVVSFYSDVRAALVGAAKKGPKQLTLVTSWDQFKSLYGPPDISWSYAHFSAQAFFRGGNALYMRRVSVNDKYSVARVSTKEGVAPVSEAQDDPSAELFDEVITTSYVLASGDGSVGGFSGVLPPTPVSPGTLTLSFTVTSNPITLFTGDGSTTSFQGNAGITKITPDTIHISVTLLGDSPVIITDDGNGNLEDDSALGVSGTVDYETGAYSLVFPVGSEPSSSAELQCFFTAVGDDDAEGNITGVYIDSGMVDYETGVVTFTTTNVVKNGTQIFASFLSQNTDAFIVYASSSGAWPNGVFAFSLERNSSALLPTEFIFREFVLNADGRATEIGNYIVSRDPQGRDGNNRSTYIEDVLLRSSQNFRVKNNINVGASVLPQMTATRFVMSQGGDGILPTAAQIAAAWDDVSDPDNVNVRVLINNGDLDPVVTSKMLSIAEDRRDCVAFLDGAFSEKCEDTIDQRNSGTSNADTSFGIMVAPWVQVIDEVTGRPVWVPASGFVAALQASTHEINPYLPPAGLNRGKVQVLDLLMKPDKVERQILTDNQVNLIRHFPGMGTALFGQFTLQKRPSATSFLNSRNTLILVQKALASVMLYHNFEFIDDNTYLSVSTTGNKILQPIQDRGGLYRYVFRCDADMQTQQSLDTRTLNALIVLQLSSTSDSIEIKVVYTQDGARFESLASDVAV